MHRTPARTPSRPEDSTGASPPADRWLNLGVLAHVDAGKTSLTEALLHAGGALEQVGRVGDGTTQTDTLAMERRRGITIRTAVATFAVDGVTVNLVDTPGHPDFIAEVDRCLAVLDGAVLVLSAVEGVQAQSVVLYRALRRLRVPTVFMINKIDRLGADPERVLAAVRRRLTPSVVALGRATDPGTAAAAYRPSNWSDPAATEAVTAVLAEHDDALLQTWVRHGRAPGAERLWRDLERLTRRGVVHPVMVGSATTGAGVDDLVAVLTDVLPVGSGDPDAAAAGQVFKVERTPAGDRVCLVRMRAGTLAVRDHVPLGPGRVGTVTALEVFAPGGPARRDRAVGGQVARLYGLAAARIGDRIGIGSAIRPATAFPLPALETTVVARDPAQRAALHAALTDLADADPLIRLRPDGHRHALRIRVYGEIQQQVIAETLAAERGIEVEFRGTSVICVERPAGRGSAALRMGADDQRFGVTLGVTVEPTAPGTGVELVIAAARQGLPLHVYSTVEGLHAALLGYLDVPLAAGPYGWQVTDIRVTVTESGYPPAGPAPAEVRHTAELVVRRALHRAGTVVCEPVDRFRVEAPSDTVAAVIGLLHRHRGVPDVPQVSATVAVITGTLPTGEVDAVRRGLHGAAHGEGVLESGFHHHTQIRGTPPRRPS